VNVLKFFNKNKNKKGFTLLETMLVIAIIVVLSIFLIPKIGVVKDNAKAAGSDTNVRMLTGYIQSNIDRYKSGQESTFETEIANAFADDNLTNPYTKMVGFADISTLSGKNTSAVTYATTDNGQQTDVTAKWEVTSPNPNLIGSVAIASYPNPNGSDTLEVAIYPYDKKGNVILTKKIVITP
jgi:prepilin-type N-terminal cleavage/methylation domain-containing protein